MDGLFSCSSRQGEMLVRLRSAIYLSFLVVRPRCPGHGCTFRIVPLRGRKSGVPTISDAVAGLASFHGLYHESGD